MTGIEAFIGSMTNDSDKPFMRAYLFEYKIDPKEAVKKYPQWAKEFKEFEKGESKPSLKKD